MLAVLTPHRGTTNYSRPTTTTIRVPGWPFSRPLDVRGVGQVPVAIRSHPLIAPTTSAGEARRDGQHPPAMKQYVAW